ncbi:MAG: transcription elongation factor GreA [Nitrospirae bacterium]|nr:transcription elongation factor GreA [Nitrospirota bacterium]
MKKIPMTKECYEKLKEELAYLKKVERSKNIKEIEEAREHGDLSENAEYHAAKERQSFIEGKIQEIQGKLAHAQVIDTSKLSGEKVVFGATVKLRHVDSNETKTYTLVGGDEADIKNGKISVQSPVGKSLIGHIIGDTVNIKTPTRDIEYEILEIKFG